MRKKILSLILLALLTSAASAVTITVNSNGRIITTSEGNLLTSGASTIRVGTFDVSGGNLDTITNSKSFSAVDALFTPVLENNAGGGTVFAANHADTNQRLHINDTGTAGNIFAQITGVSASYYGGGTQLYLWVFNAADPSSSTEWGIFSSSNVVWDFPNDDLGSSSLSTMDVDNVIVGSTGAGSLLLAPIPEPSVSLLALFASAGFVFRRRR